MGAFAGVIGGALGIINGVAVGYYYMEFSFRIKTESRLLRILKGTLYGTVAGTVSGGLVHIPGLIIEKSSEGLFMAWIGALVGAGFGTAFGLLLSWIMAFTPYKEAPAAPAAGAETGPQDTGLTGLSPEDVTLVKEVYSALKEHQLFDQYTAKTYRDKTGLESGPEIATRYEKARAWLQASRPGFTEADWDRGNAAAHKLVRFLVSARCEDGGALAQRCPGLGEEVTAWLKKSAGLFL